MGSDSHYPEEAPMRTVRVASFEIDRYELSNREFAHFVEATGYRTQAERGIGTDGPGGARFREPTAVGEQWWIWQPGANWRQPEGPGSSIEGKADLPVVQLTLEDAQAYAEWAGKRLPTEEEWEYAARGGLEGATYPWGNEREPGGRYAANYHQGAFPFADTGADGFAGRAPVGCFPPNGYGLYDMTGNVWELTAARAETGTHTVIKGGSFLCSASYCSRYRPAARQAQEITMSTNHVGVRFARSLKNGA